MAKVELYIYTDDIVDVSKSLINGFESRILSLGGIIEDKQCLYDITQELGGFYAKDIVALKVDLFGDEKISVTSSIQNVNDISKLTTDFSQVFTIPATKNNNKIFKYWFENSFDIQFSTAKKANAYIELDSIPFRVGKIQLQKCVTKNNEPQSYSINFVGTLGGLKDKFAGLFLKDLTSNEFDEPHNGNIVRDKVAVTAVSGNIMYPLISSKNYWQYSVGDYRIDRQNDPIYYTDLFPALKLKAILKLISNQFGVNFTGTFLNNTKFTSAYLLLKNAEKFAIKGNSDLIFFDSTADDYGYQVNLENETFQAINTGDIIVNRYATLNVTTYVAGLIYYIETYRNGVKILSQQRVSSIGSQVLTVSGIGFGLPSDVYFVKILAPLQLTFTCTLNLFSVLENETKVMQVSKNIDQTTSIPQLAVKNYMPEIKIEEWFGGLLKMFNLTCYSLDGINFTIETIEDFYSLGKIVNLTKYLKTDTIDISKVDAFKKINFNYEKTDSLVNVNFKSNNGIEYGDLSFDTQNDGTEYSIKLPFSNLNFRNLKDKLQVGYLLKQDLNNYIPKPIVLYDYSPLTQTALTGAHFHFSTAINGSGLIFYQYKAFGQEYKDGTNTYSLNFNEQQSTLTNELITKSLYSEYYSAYIANIFNFKARLIKVGLMLPTSILTSLKLNDRIVIKDKRYIINSFTTDLTTGEATMELLTDLRNAVYTDPYLNFITAENFQFIETENLIKLTII